MIKGRVTGLLAASVLSVALPTNAQVLKERITWNLSGQTSQSLTLYDAGSTYQDFRTWGHAGWRLVGTAGNRLLWQEQVGPQNATLWRIQDNGDFRGHVVLRPPAPGFKARSLSLSWVWAGGIPCYDRDDADQSYWILWERDAPNTQIHVQLVKGDGTVQLTHSITKPAAMGTRAALGLTQIYGNDLVVMFAQDITRTSLWMIARANMRFNNIEWLFITNPIRVPGGGLFVPASLNAYWDTAPGDGAMVQLLFNDSSLGPFQGRAIIVNVRETVSRPFGRQAIKREIWTHQSSNNVTVYATGSRHEATAHTVLPSVCP